MESDARRKEANSEEDVRTETWHDASQRENERRDLVATVKELVVKRHIYSTHLHDGGQTKNMTPMSLYSIFDNENIDRMVYPAGEEVDLAAIE